MKRLWLLAVMAVLGCIFNSQPARADVGPCQVFPADNYWNRDISAEPVHPQSASIIANINAYGGDFVHPDWGSNATEYYGIPWITVTNSQSNIDSIGFLYDQESDLGPYPIPYDAPIEGEPGATGGDRHVIVINTDTCFLYELYAAEFTGDATDGVPNTWEAGSGAIFDLNSNALRPDEWTSADAAGLPIFPGLARCDEALAGEINHALRFTINRPRAVPGSATDFYVFPARHEAGNHNDPLSPPFGARLRLRADYSEAGFTGQGLAVVKALKRYGMILADIGSNWYITGDRRNFAPGNCVWDDAQVNPLKNIPGTAFEVLAYPGTSTPSLPHFNTITPTLTWSRVTWATSYEIQVDDLASFASPNTYTAAGTSFTIPGPGLTERTYYWRVRGKDANGVFGAYSIAGSFVIALIP